MGKPQSIVDVDITTLHAMLERIESQVAPADLDLIKRMLDTLVEMIKLVREHGTTIARLRRFVGFTSSEKTARVLGKPVPPASEGGGDAPGEAATFAPGEADQGPAKSDADLAAVAGDAGKDSEPTPTPTPCDASDEAGAGAGAPAKEKDPATAKPKAKGHGRNGAADYPAARHIEVLHDKLHPGAPCPCCRCGKLYALREPARWLRIVGQPPLAATCWDCQRLRCSTCGQVFTAPAPEKAQGEKHDETAASMMALSRYRVGVPLLRLEHLQRDLETPVPSSTQWDVLDQRVVLMTPAYDEMRRQAAQGIVLHNDDTYVRILALMGKRKARLLVRGELKDPERTGLFTTAIVSIADGRQPIVVFATGRKHAGENLTELLDLRADDLGPPIQMGDALTRNLPEGHEVIPSNCLTHGRRKIVDEVENYPAECEYILVRLRRVYHVDDQCKQQQLSADERLRRHQDESGPVMSELEGWMTAQLTFKRIEPNSGMGKALNYMLKRWDKLTLFLRKSGAALDNNICERALKMAIRNRNNSLFYCTEHGAHVGDIYMTLIYTAELHGQNPFDYLTALQVHAKAVAQDPVAWMPWNYRATVARLPQPVPIRNPETHASGARNVHPAEPATTSTVAAA